VGDAHDTWVWDETLFSGAAQYYRQGRLPYPPGLPETLARAGNEAAVLTRAGFAGPERYVVPGGRVLERSPDDIVAWVFSKSGSAPHLFGTRLGEFEADLRRLLGTARFAEHQPSAEIFVWRA
jgi:hypothetical protein